MRAVKPGFLEQNVDFQQIGYALALGNNVEADAVGAIAAVGLGGRAHDVQLGQSFRRVACIRACQQPLAGQFAPQQCDALGFAERWVVLRNTRHVQQFRNHPAVHVGVLPKIQRGQVEAEGFDRAIEAGQRAAPIEPHLALRFQRVLEHFQICTQAGGIRIGRCLDAGGSWRHAAGEALICRREPGIHARNCPPVRLIGARRVHIPAPLSQLLERL